MEEYLGLAGAFIYIWGLRRFVAHLALGLRVCWWRVQARRRGPGDQEVGS